MNKLKNYKSLTIRYMKKEKGNTFAIFISLILTISLITSVVIILNNNMKLEYEQLKKENGNYDVRLINIDNEKLNKIVNSNKVNNYSIGKSEGIINKQLGEGAYDLLEIYSLNQKAYDETFGFDVIAGRMPSNSDEVLISSRIVKFFGIYYKIGDIIRVDVESNRNIEMYNYYDMYSRYKKNPVGTKDLFFTGDVMEDIYPKLEKEIKEYKVVGIVDVGDNNILWENRILGLLTEEEILGAEGLEVYTELVKGEKEKDLASEVGIKYIARNLSSNIFGVEASEVKYAGYKKDKYQSILVNDSNLTILLIVSLFIFTAIYNAFHISINRKLRYYGILRAIGATMNQISYLIIKEAAILFLLAVPIGVFIGVWGLKLQMNILNNIFKINNHINVVLSKDVIISIFVVCITTIALAVLESILKEGRFTPIEAMSGAMNIKRVKNLTARNFLGQSIEDVENDDGELEIKKILTFEETTIKYKVMKKLFKFEGEFAHKNINRNPSQNRLCIITLTSTMLMLIFFLLQTINGNIASDFAIKSDLWDVNYSSEVIAFSDEAILEIKNISGVKGVYKNLEAIIPIVVEKDKINYDFNTIFKNSGINKVYDNKVGLTAKLRGLDEEALKEYEKYMLEGTLNKEELDNGGIVLVNKATNFYFIQSPESKTGIFFDMDKPIDYKVSEEISIPLNNNVMTSSLLEDYIKNNNEYKKLKVVGIISEDAFENNINTRDTSNLNSNVTMITSEKTYDDFAYGIEKKQLYIKVDEQYTREDTIDKLEKLAGEKYYSLEDLKSIKEEIKIKTLEGLTYKIILGITVILLVILNLLNTLTANILSRKGELAALSAIGMSNSQKKKMIICESFYIGFASALLSLGTGGVLGVIFQASNSETGKVSMVMLISIMMAIVGSLVIVTIVISILPLSKLKKLNIVDTLKEDL